MEEGGLTARRFRGAAAVLAAALLFSLMAGAPADVQRGQSSQTRGQSPAVAPLPEALRTADIEAIRKTIASRRGAPLLVNFWAVWCAPCVEELPDLASIETRFAKSSVRLLGVNCDLLLEDDSADLRSRVGAVLGKAKAAYPNLLYEGREDQILEAFDLPGPLPVSILYKADGSEARRWTGILPMKELEAALADR